MLVSCYHRGLPSSFLCAASVEGKGTKGRDARSACQAGAARPYPGTVLPTGLPLPSPAPGALPTLEDGPPPPYLYPIRASHSEAPGSHPHTHPANTGTRRAPPFPSSQDRAWTTPLPARRSVPPPHPDSSRGRASVPPSPRGRAELSPLLNRTAPGSPLSHLPLPPSRGRARFSPHGSAPSSRSIPSRQRARLSPPPLSLPRALARCGSPGPALPAQPGAGDTEPPAPPLPAARSLPFESTTRWRRPRGRSLDAGRHSNRAVQSPPRRLLRQPKAEPHPPGALRKR